MLSFLLAAQQSWYDRASLRWCGDLCLIARPAHLSAATQGLRFCVGYFLGIPLSNGVRYAGKQAHSYYAQLHPASWWSGKHAVSWWADKQPDSFWAGKTAKSYYAGKKFTSWNKQYARVDIIRVDIARRCVPSFSLRLICLCVQAMRLSESGR